MAFRKKTEVWEGYGRHGGTRDGDLLQGATRSWSSFPERRQEERGNAYEVMKGSLGSPPLAERQGGPLRSRPTETVWCQEPGTLHGPTNRIEPQTWFGRDQMNLKSKLFGTLAAATVALSMMGGVMAADSDRNKSRHGSRPASCVPTLTSARIGYVSATWTWDGS